MKKFMLMAILLVTIGFQSSAQSTGTHCGHDWVDLGLSVKWATRNVGAYSDLSAGDKFFYGETTVRSKANPNRMVGVSLESIAGNKLYDAAAANWGGSWRMPTWQNFRELIDCCTWTSYEVEGKEYMKATSKINGQCMSFPLPDMGRDYFQHKGYYWSSTFDGNCGGCLHLYVSSGWGEYAWLEWIDFSTACSIRPVLD